MKIGGLQKTTVIDYPGKIACTLFIYGCNFRCGFCHNPELVLAPLENEISQEEILEFLENRKNQLEGVCITGGEPLMSLDLDFVKKIKEMSYAIKIDTNGSFPEKLKELIELKLVDYIAMDIKASREKYDDVTNVEVELKKIEECMKLVDGFGAYEFRTTIVKGIHSVEEMENLSLWMNGVLGHKPRKFCLQGFKNKGKVIENIYKMKKDVGKEFLEEIKEAIKGYFEEIEIRV